LADAIRTAFEEVSELEYEMEAKYENAPDWAQKSDANQRRILAATMLGMAREPIVHGSLCGDSHLVTWWEKGGKPLQCPTW